jgi:hypothetical protein
VTPDQLSLAAFVISAVIVGVGGLAWWVRRRGWRAGRVPRE